MRTETSKTRASPSSRSPTAHSSSPAARRSRNTQNRQEKGMFAGPNHQFQVFSLAVACLCALIVLLDVSIVSLALPTIQASLRASRSDLRRVVDAYPLPFVVRLFTAGTLGDGYGRKRLFVFWLAG